MNTRHRWEIGYHWRRRRSLWFWFPPHHKWLEGMASLRIKLRSVVKVFPVPGPPWRRRISPFPLRLMTSVILTLVNWFITKLEPDLCSPCLPFISSNLHWECEKWKIRRKVFYIYLPWSFSASNIYWLKLDNCLWPDKIKILFLIRNTVIDPGGQWGSHVVFMVWPYTKLTDLDSLVLNWFLLGWLLLSCLSMVDPPSGPAEPLATTNAQYY